MPIPIEYHLKGSAWAAPKRSTPSPNILAVGISSKPVPPQLAALSKGSSLGKAEGEQVKRIKRKRKRPVRNFREGFLRKPLSLVVNANVRSPVLTQSSNCC